jgi:hypothetical protein
MKKALFATLAIAALGITLLIHFNQKPSFEELITQDLTFGEWTEAYDEANYGSDERKLIIQKMAETARSFQQWDIVRQKADYKSSFDGLALQNMIKTARTTKEWYELLTFTYDSELRQLATTNIKELCSSFEDWQALHQMSAGHYSGEKYIAEMALENMLVTTQNFDQAKYVFDRLPKDSERYQATMATMSELAVDYTQWKTIFDAARWSDKQHKSLALSNMRTLANNFNEWRTVYAYHHSDHDSPERLAAIEHMAEHANDFLEWADVYIVTPDEHRLKQIAFVLMDGSPLGFDRWYDVWTTHSSDKIKSLAFSKLCQEAYTFDQWHKIWKSSPSGSDTESMALARMQELTTATP